jgi:hypothetical protein
VSETKGSESLDRRKEKNAKMEKLGAEEKNVTHNQQKPRAFFVYS